MKNCQTHKPLFPDDSELPMVVGAIPLWSSASWCCWLTLTCSSTKITGDSKSMVSLFYRLSITTYPARSKGVTLIATFHLLVEMQRRFFLLMTKQFRDVHSSLGSFWKNKISITLEKAAFFVPVAKTTQFRLI